MMFHQEKKERKKEKKKKKKMEMGETQQDSPFTIDW